MPGETIEVRWPVGKIVVESSDPRWDWTMSAVRQEVNSADPNDFYRPELEQSIGVQGWDWDWKIGSIAENTLLIKFRRGKEFEAPYFALKWA